jgi:hypothetical protein
MEGPIPYGVAMRGKLSRVAVLLLVVAGCSTTGTPATVPPSLPATTTTVATTTTTLPPTTTTTVATTTTIDRVTEIEAIFQDLEERRLQALYEGDEEAFKTLFANKDYMQRSLAVLDLVEFASPPDVVVVNLVDLLRETETCIAALVLTDATDAFGSDGLSERIIVLERLQGHWGFSYIGEGWACEGPHPLSP